MYQLDLLSCSGRGHALRKQILQVLYSLFWIAHCSRIEDESLRRVNDAVMLQDRCQALCVKCDRLTLMSVTELVMLAQGADKEVSE